uniref:Putative tail protein n=1 Tax=viral metagenome TaxID=1070528 RepID=A0A6M3IDY0_9ZZZZ
MKTSVEFETKKFNAAIKKFAAKSELSTEKVIRKIAFDLLAGILSGLPKADNFTIPNTEGITGRHPILTGRARAAWYPSVVGLGGNFNFSSGANIKDSEVARGKKEGAFKNNLKNFVGEKYVTLINNVPYILFLEYGSSLTAPAGMVRISMRRMTGRMPKELSKEFLTEWNKFNF